jgi:FkbM family methyltransferase
MKITQYFRSASEHLRAFKLIYGRSPTKAELATLEHLAKLPLKDESRIFRAIIGSYDHQFLRTPFSVRFSDKDVAYVATPGFQLAVDALDFSVSQPLASGNYEAHLRAFYQARLKPGMTFVDVGANIGLYSMLAAQLVGDSGRVISFEPNSENCRLVLLSIIKNRFANVSLFPFALSDKTGYTFFATFLGSNGGMLPSDESVLNDPNCTVVPTMRMDDFIKERVDVIKIDVEGAEGLVVRGAQKLIEMHRPLVTSEFSMEMLPRVSRISGYDYLNYFKEHAYDAFIIDRASGELIAIQSAEAFLEAYGPPTRIEDLVFVPR